MWSPRQASAISPTSFSCSARNAIRALSPAPSSRRARKAPIDDHARARRYRRLGGAFAPGDIHPATRTFQALRIFVNDELGELAAALAAAERVLKPGGRLVAVSFHSLEDRIVKTSSPDAAKARAGSRHAPEVERPQPTFRMLTKRPVTADDEEVARNPRARSAKLRAAERTAGAGARRRHADLLPRLPSLADVVRGR